MLFVWYVLLAYLAGVLIGLWKTDAPVARRITLALLWPVGLLAVLVTVPLLLAAALVLFPTVGVLVVAGAAAVWWLTV